MVFDLNIINQVKKVEQLRKDLGIDQYTFSHMIGIKDYKQFLNYQYPLSEDNIFILSLLSDFDEKYFTDNKQNVKHKRKTSEQRDRLMQRLAFSMANS